ncbi:MAG: PilZ domain-containing protein [Desulfobacterales bacterium]|nr:PilZ domain-containing protein [Desulfobacterales bacterium]
MNKVQNMQEERRLSNRIFFSMKDGPVALFTLPEHNDETISATIMDLSAGGLGLSFRKEENIKIHEGDHLILTEIKNIVELEEVADIELKIRWLRNYDAFKHILFGCEFINISEPIREQIWQFVNSWIMK